MKTEGGRKYWVGTGKEISKELYRSRARSKAFWTAWGQGLAESALEAVPVYDLAARSVGAGLKVVKDLVRSRKRKMSTEDAEMTPYSVRRRSDGGNRGVQFVEAADFTEHRVRSGKRSRKNLRQAWKRLKASTIRTVLRVQGLTPFASNGTVSNGVGYFNIPNCIVPDAPIGGASPVPIAYFPLHVYDVTSWIVQSAPPATPSTNGQVFGGCPGYQLVNYQTSANNYQVGFIRTPFQLPNAQKGVYGNQPRWMIESSGIPGIDQLNKDPAVSPYTGMNLGGGSAALRDLPFSFSKDILKWIDIRAIFYGRAGISTKFTVQLVQIHGPDWLHPEFLTANNGAVMGTASTGDRELMNTFWTNWVSKELFNPLQTYPGGNDIRKMVKVLKSHSFMIQPPSGGDGEGGTGHQHLLKWFCRFNRVQNYLWNPGNIAFTGVNEVKPVNLNDNPLYPILNGNLNPYVHPHSRIYLVIKAQSTELNLTNADQTPPKSILAGTGAAQSYQNQTSLWPKYDFMLRACHESV